MDSPYKLGATDESVVTPAGESESIIGDSTSLNNKKPVEITEQTKSGPVL